MNRTGKPGDKAEPSSREERLAEELRRNLHRRKAQARQRKATSATPGEDGQGSKKPTS